MLDVLRSSSRLARNLTLAGFTALMLSGCSTTTYENSVYFDEDNRAGFEKRKKPPNDSVITGSVEETHVEKVDVETETQVGLRASDASTQSVRKFGIEPNALSGVRIIPESAACRYLRKSADSEAIIVGSPTASASTDEDGSGSVSIGMNLLDFKKAELIRASGDAKCRLHEASKKIEATLGLGLEATRFANAWAKYEFIKQNLGKLRAIKAEANNMMQQGALTVQDTNLISQRASELKAVMTLSKAEADQRRDLPALDISQIRSRHGALVEATNDLQNIEREIRTNDALELSLNTGYRFNDRFNSDLQRDDSEGTFASLSLGVRLGSLSQTRKQLENEATAAKLDALFEENTGTIWKSGFSKAATDRMIADLRQSERQLLTSIRITDDTITKLSKAERPETIRARLQAKVEKLRISSNLAGVRASIRQLKTNSQNIGALSQ